MASKKENENKNTDKTLKSVSSATENMSALIDDIIKKARKNFKATGKPEVDARFLKESVGALKELYELLAEYDGFGGCDEGIIIRFEKELEKFCK
ncbi:MAG: hypothetical protein IJN94_00620 [Clostridia bacterium]|nr:hypothetical protein [Clostridia bacterium]